MTKLAALQVENSNELPFGFSADDHELNRAWGILSKHIDRILDSFFENITDSLIKNLVEKADIPALKKKQKEHWKRIFLGEMDSEHYERLAQMHMKHSEIGLPTVYYISSYLFLSRQFHESISAEVQDIDEARKMMSVVDGVIAMDIVRALTAYRESPHFFGV